LRGIYGMSVGGKIRRKRRKKGDAVPSRERELAVGISKQILMDVKRGKARRKCEKKREDSRIERIG